MDFFNKYIGDETEFFVEFQGIPPFSFTYTRDSAIDESSLHEETFTVKDIQQSKVFISTWVIFLMRFFSIIYVHHKVGHSKLRLFMTSIVGSLVSDKVMLMRTLLLARLLRNEGENGII